MSNSRQKSSIQYSHTLPIQILWHDSRNQHRAVQFHKWNPEPASASASASASAPEPSAGRRASLSARPCVILNLLCYNDGTHQPQTPPRGAQRKWQTTTHGSMTYELKEHPRRQTGDHHWTVEHNYSLQHVSLVTLHFFIFALAMHSRLRPFKLLNYFFKIIKSFLIIFV